MSFKQFVSGFKTVTSKPNVELKRGDKVYYIDYENHKVFCTFDEFRDNGRSLWGKWNMQSGMVCIGMMPRNRCFHENGEPV